MVPIIFIATIIFFKCYFTFQNHAKFIRALQIKFSIEVILNWSIYSGPFITFKVFILSIFGRRKILVRFKVIKRPSNNPDITFFMSF